MTQFAPVVIPTLNRYEHLKNCIESLAKNKYAKETDLYISLDYPPTEKYAEGYQKVKAYLNAGIEGFKNVYIFYQEWNLGPADNSAFLYEKIWEENDRLIYSEDDNTFSEVFLEYINKSLDKYEMDESVFAIGGYCWPVCLEHKGQETFRTHFFSAWGFGTWKEKWNKFKAFRRTDLIQKLTDRCFRKQLKLFNKHIYEQALYVASEKHHLQIYRKTGDVQEYVGADYLFCIFMYIYKQYMIVPFIPKVINHGNDGSGQNCGKNNKKYEEQKLDNRNQIILDDAEELSYMDGKKLSKFINQYRSKSIKAKVKSWVMIQEIKNTAKDPIKVC